MKWIQRLIGIVLVAGIGGGIVWAFQPQPVLVDLATVERGPLEVTINEDGQTRIKEKYIVSTPVGGRLQRIDLEPGDPVLAGKTVLATIQPSNPSLLDARSLAQAKARVSAAKSAVERAKSRVNQAQLDHDQATKDYQEARELIQTDAISQKAYDRAYTTFQSTREQVRAARFDRDIANYELEMAQSALLRFQSDGKGADADVRDEFFLIHSPIQGVVLKVLQESSTVVTPGMPIMEVGDPADLEIVVDLLSSDAVQVRPGTPVRIEQWGGKKPLQGSVRLVEPSAFLKVSALGVEEQRVNVVIDFERPDSPDEQIGDGYRVEARVIVWQGEQVLKVPTSALFRDRGQWAVFVVEDGRARLVHVELGQRNDLEAEIRKGLSENQTVVLHPGDAISDRTLVTQRQSE